MSDSTDNTNELDSYGVWVKRPPKDALQDDFSSPQEETESFDSSSIDLPEITDFDEMDLTSIINKLSKVFGLTSLSIATEFETSKENIENYLEAVENY